MKEIPEHVIQQQIFNYFNNNYCLKKHNPRLIIYSVPNGIPVTLPPKEMSRALDALNKIGMTKGISDLKIEGLNGRTISVEVKTSIGKQSKEQIEMQKRVKDLGGIYIVVRSLEQFQTEIQKHLVYLLNP
jgi:hypothetical protein